MSHSAHDSNGFNPFLDPADHLQASHRQPEFYQNPFSDEAPGVAPAKPAEAAINPFTDPESPEHTTAAAPYVNPFHDDVPHVHEPAATGYRNPFLEPHTGTDASEPAEGYTNPFEESVSGQFPAQTAAGTRSMNMLEAEAFNPFEDPPPSTTDAISSSKQPNQASPTAITYTQSASQAAEAFNPFEDPPSPITAAPASTERLYLPHTPAADAFNPFHEDVSVSVSAAASTHLAQPTSAQSVAAAHSKQEPLALWSEQSELPPFTVADLRATTSDLPSLTRQPTPPASSPRGVSTTNNSFHAPAVADLSISTADAPGLPDQPPVCTASSGLEALADSSQAFTQPRTDHNQPDAPSAKASEVGIGSDSFSPFTDRPTASQHSHAASEDDSFVPFTRPQGQSAHPDSIASHAKPSTSAAGKSGNASIPLSGAVQEQQDATSFADFGDFDPAPTAEDTGIGAQPSHIPQTDTGSQAVSAPHSVQATEQAPADIIGQDSAELADSHSMSSAAITGSPTSSPLPAHSLHQASIPATSVGRGDALDALQEPGPSQAPGAEALEMHQRGRVITASTDLDEALPSQGELDQHTAHAAAKLGIVQPQHAAQSCSLSSLSSSNTSSIMLAHVSDMQHRQRCLCTKLSFVLMAQDMKRYSMMMRQQRSQQTQLKSLPQRSTKSLLIHSERRPLL